MTTNTGNSSANNRDMAYQIGERLIRQWQRIIAMENFISEYCLTYPSLTTVDWRKEVMQNQTEDSVQKTLAAWQSGLRNAIDAETQDSSLIHVLHTELITGKVLNILEE